MSIFFQETLPVDCLKKMSELGFRIHTASVRPPSVAHFPDIADWGGGTHTALGPEVDLAKLATILLVEDRAKPTIEDFYNIIHKIIL